MYNSGMSNYVDLDIYTLNLDKRLDPFKKRLTERKYTAKNIQSTYRVLNHWATQGIIDAAQPEANGWRKFSIVDIIWLDTITELRKYGMPIEKLKEYYKSFYKDSMDSKKSLPRFEFCVFLAWAGNPVFIVVYENGLATTVGAHDTLETLWKLGEFIDKRSYVMINLNNIANKYLKSKDQPRFPVISDLTSKENAILDLIRKGDYKEVKIVFKDKEPLLFEGKEILRSDSKIGDVLKDQKYQTIELITEESKIVKFERVVKKKI